MLVNKSIIIALCFVLTLAAVGKAAAFPQNKALNPAMALFLQGDYRGALDECYRLENNTADARFKSEIWYLEGLCYQKTGNYDRAHNMFGRALADAGAELSAEISLAIADTYFMQEAFPLAINGYRRLLERPGTQDHQAMLYFKLGRAHQQNGEWARANYYFAELKKKFPESFEVELAGRFDAGGDFFTIQVGSFTVQGNALKLYDDLRSKGYDAYLVEYQLGGRKLYRVRVGKLSTRLAAKSLEKELQSKEHLPTHIFP